MPFNTFHNSRTLKDVTQLMASSYTYYLTCQETNITSVDSKDCVFWKTNPQENILFFFSHGQFVVVVILNDGR